MNERIRELIKQADLHGDSFGRVINAGDFAEMILAECILVLQAYKGGVPAATEGGINLAQNIIKEHFGLMSK